MGILEVVITSAGFLFFLPNHRPSKPPFEGLSVALDGSAEGVFRADTFVSSLPAFMSREEEVDDLALSFICSSRDGKGGACPPRPSALAPIGNGGCPTSFGPCCPRGSRESEGG